MTVLIWGIVLLHEQPQNTLTFPSKLSVMTADSDALPSSTDGRWQPYSPTDLALSNSTVWLKFSLAFLADGTVSEHATPAQRDVNDPKGLFISLLGAYEVYLNNTYIGRNGQPASHTQPEQPGNIDSVFLLPPHLLQEGENEVTLRFSSQLRPASMTHSGIWVFADTYNNLVTLNQERIRLPLMMLSGLFLVAVYSFTVYLSSHRVPAYLWFSGLSMMLVLLIVAESWRGLFSYPYPWHLLRMEVVLWLTFITSIFLPLFFMAFFHYPRKVTHRVLFLLIVIYAAVIMGIEGYDSRSFILFSLGLTASFVIGVVSIKQHKQHSWLMTIGIVVFVSPVLVSRFSFMDQYFFVSFSCLALLMLLVLNQTHTERQKALIQSTLTTQRLELELVKKQLQPHFILNTLTAIEEWIDTSPQEAVTFIQALALEFRQMAQLSHQSLITFAQEIALCESHLKIMGYRFDASFTLNTENIDNEALLPPGILLTLIENAFSHNHYTCGQYQFDLYAEPTITSQAHAAAMTQLVFKAQRCKTASQAHSSETKASGTGVGTKYIKARLSEAYGQQWHFEEYDEPDFWVANLRFPNQNNA